MKQRERDEERLHRIRESLKIVLETHGLEIANIKRAINGPEEMPINIFFHQLYSPDECPSKHRSFDENWILLGGKRFGDREFNFIIFRDGHCCERWEYRELPSKDQSIEIRNCIWCDDDC